MVGEGNEEARERIIVATERTTSSQLRLFTGLLLRPSNLCMAKCFYCCSC